MLDNAMVKGIENKVIWCAGTKTQILIIFLIIKKANKASVSNLISLSSIG